MKDVIGLIHVSLFDSQPHCTTAAECLSLKEWLVQEWRMAELRGKGSQWGGKVDFDGEFCVLASGDNFSVVVTEHTGRVTWAAGGNTVLLTMDVYINRSGGIDLEVYGTGVYTNTDLDTLRTPGNTAWAVARNTTLDMVKLIATRFQKVTVMAVVGPRTSQATLMPIETAGTPTASNAATAVTAPAAVVTHAPPLLPAGE